MAEISPISNMQASAVIPTADTKKTATGKALSFDPNNPDHVKLRKATRAMESYFVGVLLKKMHENASKGGLFEEKSETQTYRDMFDDAVAKEIGKNSSFGIADSLYRETVGTLKGVKNE